MQDSTPTSTGPLIAFRPAPQMTELADSAHPLRQADPPALDWHQSRGVPGRWVYAADGRRVRYRVTQAGGMLGLPVTWEALYVRGKDDADVLGAELPDRYAAERLCEQHAAAQS